MNRILIGGQWHAADAVGEFSPSNPNTGVPLDEVFPVSSARDADAALEAAGSAVAGLRDLPDEARAEFLRSYAAAIEYRRAPLVEMAHAETGLPTDPRLNGELSRTVNQLDQAADAVVEGSWVDAIIDTASNIRSMFAPLQKPVVVFGPNNFPFAFNGISGGDFAAAIAAGNPVIVKGHPGHPVTTRILAEAAHEAMSATDVPASLVQLLYHIESETGFHLVSDRRVGAIGFTGSQRGGLALKEAADRAGIPIYLEMGSINPVFMLENALRSRGEGIAEEFYASCTLGTGQYCTNPGMVILLDGAEGDAFVERAVSLFSNGEPGVLLGSSEPVGQGVETLRRAGAELLTGGYGGDEGGFRFANTLLTVSAKDYLNEPETLQREVFGPVSLLVRAADVEEMSAVASSIEGNLTGSIYSDPEDDDAYWQIETALRRRVGRLLNDKMPTGVAVVPSMNHGGPYPATAHPGFTSVGVPTSIPRFSALHCYDNVAERRLPAQLRNKNPNGLMWRRIDGEWTRGDVD